MKTEICILFEFFKKGIASFVTLAEAAGICIAVSEKILRRAEDADYDRIIERLSQKSSARGVVMFADEDETRWNNIQFSTDLKSIDECEWQNFFLKSPSAGII